MARARKLHCVCGTPVMSAADYGLEFRCECGTTMFIPYAHLSGVEHLARFLEGQAAAKPIQFPPSQVVGARTSPSPASGAAASLTRGSERPAFSRSHEPAGGRSGFFVLGAPSALK